MSVKFDFENVKDSVTVSLPGTPEKKIEFKNDSCVTINSTGNNLSKYNNIFSNYLDSAEIELGSISIGPEKIEIKNMELDKLNARIEMLIELVGQLNKDNAKLNEKVDILTEKLTQLEAVVNVMDKSTVTNTTTITDWSKVFNAIMDNTSWHL